jgi:hypothetical protein
MPVMKEVHEGHKLELAVEVLNSGGAIRLEALGTSMLPSIWPGDILTIEHRPGKEMVAGDIVLVARDRRFFVHRLIAKHSSRWITRGDCLPQNDESVAEVQVLGKVSLIDRKTAVLVPAPRVSPFARSLAWTLCRSDFLRRISLRAHRFRQNGSVDFSLALPSRGRPRPRQASGRYPRDRRPDAGATVTDGMA